MAIDLLFTWAPATSGYLVFGDTGVSPPTPDALVSIASGLPGLSGSIPLGIPTTLHLSANLPDLGGTIKIIGNGRIAVTAVADLPALGGVVPVRSYPIHHVAVVADLPALGGVVPVRSYPIHHVAVVADLPALGGVVPVRSYPIHHVTVVAELPALGGVIELSSQDRSALVHLFADLPALSAAITLEYDSRTERPDSSVITSTWQGAQNILHASSSVCEPALQVPHSSTSAWEKAQTVVVPFAAPWQEADRIYNGMDNAFEAADRCQSASTSRYDNSARAVAAFFNKSEDGIRLTTAQRSGFQETYRDRVNDSSARFAQAITQTCSVASSLHSGLRVFTGIESLYAHAIRPLSGMWVRPQPIVPGIYTHSAALLFAEPWSSAMEMVFISDRDASNIWDGLPKKALVTIPVLEFYMIFNTASLRRVDGDIALACTSMTLNLDADSWAWGFSASLPSSALQDLEPDSYGTPVELEAIVNGTAFRVLAEGITRERTFGKSDIRLSGRGKTALLDGPYAPVRNFSNTGDRTAQQLMADVLSVNGVSMDWALDWQLDDWLVPTGVFSHQGSYISAVNTIAAAAGGYVQPHASLQTLRVLPRYPSAPWDWPALAPDLELPAAITTREGIEWVERARYNRVFISGQQSGILGQVTRTGTAGDLLAPIVVDPLITTVSAARQRGLSVLSNTGRQANITLGLPVLPETGIILPGSMVRYVDAGVPRLGIARSVGLTIGFPETWQSVGIETHV